MAYATSDGTATAGSDYAAASGNVSWAAGDAAAKSFVVAITNDSTAETNETVTLTLSAKDAKALKLGRKAIVIGTVRTSGTGTLATTLKLNKAGKKAIARRGKRTLRATLQLHAVDGAKNARNVRAAVRIG